jgi:hypothetical protein
METFLDIGEDQTVRLLTDVIHKIKNSLGGIGGFAALLERDLGADDPRAELARRVQGGVMRMNDFVVDLMLFLQNPELEFKTVNPASIIKQAWSEFWDEEEPPAGALEISGPSGPCRLDEETFLYMAGHAFRFAKRAGGAVEHVRFFPALDKVHRLEVTFPATPNVQVEKGSPPQRLKTCEPVEAKLSLYLVVKLAKFNEARTSLEFREPGHGVLAVTFNW